ncbi:uncharacterized protein LOC131659468 [Vicia villosa]|uniref:uncharacterized protein LOC131659468 n=1 Tax=Vicia villosa TaxID=3911 RepID=UPI00273AC7C0|nr:uncharacterized protein LOC131659468 [Vicia villosa]
MSGMQGVGPTYTQPGMATFSPNAGLVGRSVQNPGPSGQMPTLTTNNQAAFRQEMDASNHDMVGVLAQEMGSEVPEEQPRVVVVNREQNAYEVVQRVRRDNVAIENNQTTLIERIMANNGLFTGLRRPNYTSPVADYILQTELPRGTKVPKFTKNLGETGESTMEHIARYLTEAGDLENSENFRVKYFPSSLTKNAFTWFTTLPPNSIDTWAHLERLFHRHFYMGQTKNSLKELLADRVRQVERLKAEKARAYKNYKKERVAYVEPEDIEVETLDDSYGFDEVEIDLAKLKEAPPYSCKLLTHSNGKNPVEPDKSD